MLFSYTKKKSWIELLCITGWATGRRQTVGILRDACRLDDRADDANARAE